MKQYILNSFSLNMLGRSKNFNIIGSKDLVFTRTGDVTIRGKDFPSLQQPKAINAIGHKTTRVLVAATFGAIWVQKAERSSVTLEPGDVALVFQYKGPRLPEGTSKLPAGCSIEPILVEVR